MNWRAVKKVLIEHWGILAALIAINVFFSVASPYYFSLYTFTSLLDHGTYTLILATGMVLVIATGGIDVSVGSTIAYTGFVVALLFKAGIPPVLAVLAGFLVGALIGGINGVVIAKLRLQPFIVTLAMLSIARGLTHVFSKGYAVTGLPISFINVFAGQGSIRHGVYIGFGVAILGAIVINKTRFGLYVRGIGGSEECTFLCGVNTDRIKISVYIIQGLLATLASMTFLAAVDAAEPSAGLATEWLEAIAAPIIGGNSLSGGKATIFGTIIGAFILASLRSGLNIFRVNPAFQQVVIGLIIIGAVVIDSLRTKT